jgi:hypothetical protein
MFAILKRTEIVVEQGTFSSKTQALAIYSQLCLATAWVLNPALHTLENIFA